jgi:hypothetical protein
MRACEVVLYAVIIGCVKVAPKASPPAVIAWAVVFV